MSVAPGPGLARHGTVSHWMTRDPVAVSDDCPVRVAVARMRQAEVRHLLVTDGDRLCGILSTRDLGRLALSPAGPSGLDSPVRLIMSEDVVAVAPETTVAEAARLLLERKIGALPVRDGDRIVGIFTGQDALEALLVIAERL